MGLLFGCSTIVVLFSLISLAFLIIATITPPATNVFGLAEAEDIRYGVFGYCSTMEPDLCDTGSPFYKVSRITMLNDWKMDDNARDTLIKILIVTPITAALTLLSLLFNLLAHFSVFGKSTAFYIITFIVSLLAFIGAALTVIVTFLLFYPHVRWPAWILIGSAVLNLVSVPLVFFAMRTAPTDRSDDDEMGEDNNLTDLSDGDNFKHKENFRLNTLPSTTSYDQRSGEKFIPGNPAIKVITDDSSLSGDHFEKVSMQDYSRTGQGNSNSTFRKFDYGTDTTAPPTGSASAGTYSDGTPNLVSTQNYSRGGAVRSEAPAFLPQSVKTETATSSAYPTTQYSSQQLPSSRAGNGNSQDIQAQDPQQYGNQSSTTDPSPYPLSVLHNTTGSDPMTQNTGDYTDYDNDINDNDSDFTSVSQRAANPRYYRSFQQGPSLFPEGSSQHPANDYYMKNPYQQQRPGGPPSTGSYPPQQYQQQQQPPQMQSQFAPVSTPQQQQAPVRDTSAYLLSQNPDFAIGGAPFQKPYAKKGTSSPASSGYRPAYKKRIGSGNKLPAASLSADSPYNFR